VPELLVDNDFVRASVSTFAPGELSGEHEHRYPRFVFVLSEGTLETVEESGTQRTTLVRESCLYAAPVRHSVRNIGETTASLLEIEIKEGRGPSKKVQACSDLVSPPPDGRRRSRESRKVRRRVLLAGPDLVASRVEIPHGRRERGGSIRGPRLLYIVRGGPLETRQPNGSRAVATEGAALWAGEDAPMINKSDSRDLVLIEVTPTAKSAGE
jgi:quercetin dioxygenase-like cupin family protein